MDRYEEAIKIVRLCCPKIDSSECDFETAMRVLVPELAESEDERCRKAIIEDYKVLGDASLRGAKVTLELKNVEEKIAWLEKQKEQKPAEWSEEDERHIENIKALIRDYRKGPFKEDIDWMLERLKSLRPQPHWKPSEEQMDALKESSTSWMNETMGNAKILESLYEQLKKLM